MQSTHCQGLHAFPFAVSRLFPNKNVLTDRSIDPHLHEVGEKQKKVRKPKVIVDSSPLLSVIDVIGKGRDLLGPRDAENAIVNYVHDNDAPSSNGGFEPARRTISFQNKVQAVSDSKDTMTTVADVRILDNAAVGGVRQSPDFSADKESSNEEVIPALTDLADIIAESVIQLKKRPGLEKVCWHHLRKALHERISLLADTLPILPSFGEDCDAQLAMLLPRVRTLATVLALDVGDTVEVKYDDRWYTGVVTGMQDALRADGAEVIVRYGDDGGVIAEDPAEEGIRLVAACPRPSVQEGKMTTHTAPFHLSKACVGNTAVEALRALELVVRTLVEALKHLPVWSSQGARPGRALRKHVAEIANRAAEARGWLTGVWPRARLSDGQIVEGLSQRGQCVATVAARVLRIVDGGARGVRAEVRFGCPAGAWTEWVAQAEWAGRFRDGGWVWPGGDGLDGERDCDDSKEDSDERGGAGAKRRRSA
jgi:hypothetical protein